MLWGKDAVGRMLWGKDVVVKGCCGDRKDEVVGLEFKLNKVTNQGSLGYQLLRFRVSETTCSNLASPRGPVRILQDVYVSGFNYSIFIRLTSLHRFSYNFPLAVPFSLT